MADTATTTLQYIESEANRIAFSSSADRKAKDGARRILAHLQTMKSLHAYRDYAEAPALEEVTPQ